MTDTELLDGLQGILDAHVLVLRTCRSGCKIEVTEGGMQYWPDDVARSPEPVREYFGSGWPGQYGDRFGPNIRTAIERAIQGEAP